MLAVAGGCAGGETGEADAASPPSDASAGGGEKDTSESPDKAGPEGPPIGECEQFQIGVEVRTADGKPTIARVEVSGPCQVMNALCGGASTATAPFCAAPDGGTLDAANGAGADAGTVDGPSAGSDGGNAGCASVLITANSEGSCGVRITSLSGEQLCAAIEIVRMVSNTSCRDYYGRVHPDVPFLRASPPELTVRFGAADAGPAAD